MSGRRRRARGDGSVFRRGDGTWVAQVSVRGPDGRRKYISRWRKTERSARLALDGLLGQVAAGADPAAEMRTLDTHLEAWLRDVKPTIRPTTWRSYESHVRLHISPLLGGIPVGRLRSTDVRRLIADRLEAGRSPATVGLIVTTLSMALAGLVRDGVLVRNPVAGVGLPRVDRAPIEALPPERARRILEAVAGDPHEALYVLLLGSGLRLGEAIALEWRDVDLEGATIRIRDGKTRASRRTVPVPAFVVDALREHRARSTIVGAGEPVFRGTRKGERLRGDTITHAFPRLLADHGLPRMRVHDLRHGTATLLLSRGTPMRVIADQLGHANPAITANVYAHVIEAQQRGAIDDLDVTIRGHRRSG